jgi:hypothetical protein
MIGPCHTINAFALPEAEWVCNGHRRGRKMRKEDGEGR